MFSVLCLCSLVTMCNPPASVVQYLSRLSEQGYTAGYEHGFKQGLLEGYTAGQDKGAQIGSEVIYCFRTVHTELLQ